MVSQTKYKKKLQETNKSENEQKYTFSNSITHKERKTENDFNHLKFLQLKVIKRTQPPNKTLLSFLCYIKKYTLKKISIQLLLDGA